MTSQVPSDRHPEPTVQPLPELAEPPRRLPGWRLWLPLVFQSALIVLIPAHNAYTYLTGRTVILQTAPVDPYDLLRGYSQTLGYDISNVTALAKLPGGEWLQQAEGGDVYVVLEAPPPSDARPPKAWKPVRVSRDRPTDLPDNQIAIKGQFDRWRIVYGLETYYMPEDQREQVNATISQAQRPGGSQAFVVETRVDAAGNAIPISLWVRDRNYRF